MHNRSTPRRLRRSSSQLRCTWSTWRAVINRTSRAGELRSAPSGPDDWHRVAGKKALALGVRGRRQARALFFAYRNARRASPAHLLLLSPSQCACRLPRAPPPRAVAIRRSAPRMHRSSTLQQTTAGKVRQFMGAASKQEAKQGIKARVLLLARLRYPLHGIHTSAAPPLPGRVRHRPVQQPARPPRRRRRGVRLPRSTTTPSREARRLELALCDRSFLLQPCRGRFFSLSASASR